MLLTDGGTLVAIYGYDGLNRRTIVDDGVTERHSYYSEDWQLLEERLGATRVRLRPNASSSGVSAAIDDLVLRDRSPTNNGTLSERPALQDANWNVTALVDDGGDVVERYRYEAMPTVLQPDFTPSPKLPSLGRFATADIGMTPNAGLYYVRNRYLNDALGEWITRDPFTYYDGVNMYEYVNNNPINNVDPSGTHSPP